MERLPTGHWSLRGNAAYFWADKWPGGELVIGGDGLAVGYLKNEHMTNEKFITLNSSGERAYRTGDWARSMPDGRLECLGRI